MSETNSVVMEITRLLNQDFMFRLPKTSKIMTADELGNLGKALSFLGDQMSKMNELNELETLVVGLKKDTIGDVIERLVNAPGMTLDAVGMNSLKEEAK